MSSYGNASSRIEKGSDRKRAGTATQQQKPQRENAHRGKNIKTTMSKAKQHKLLKRIHNHLAGREDSSVRSVSPMVHIAFAIVMLIGGIAYLIEVNETSTQGFKIHTLEQHVEQLQGIQKELEMRQAEVNSLSLLKEKAKSLDLVSVNRVETLNGQGPLALGR
jgi:hypothetical protein